MDISKICFPLKACGTYLEIDFHLIKFLMVMTSYCNISERPKVIFSLVLI